MKPYRIPEIAQKYVEYDMIQAHIDLPKLAEYRLRLLYAFLGQSPMLAKHSELYTVVISLVQLGMDTHDLIDTESNPRSERDMRSRQLKVLAGDYFSARFYQLLSQAEQIDMIAKISDAVCEVNRLKVNMYVRMRHNKMNAEQYLIEASELRATLFQLFTDVVDESAVLLWTEMLHVISYCEVVLDELERSEDFVRFYKSWAYWHVWEEGTASERQWLIDDQLEPAVTSSLVRKYEVRPILTAKLKEKIESVNVIAGKLATDKLHVEWIQIIDSLLNKFTGLTPALNEMR